MNYISIINQYIFKTISSNICILNKQMIITLAFVFCSLWIIEGNIFAQNTTITFSTKANSMVSISKEIDNTYTPTLIDSITTDSTGNYTYIWNVEKFQFVNCSFHDGVSIFFPIREDSHLTIRYNGDTNFEFTGRDMDEIEYYTNGYKNITRPFVGAVLSFPSESSYEDFSTLLEEYYTMLSHDLDSLIIENKISSHFAEIVKHDFDMLTICIATSIYGAKQTTNVNPQDSIKIESRIDDMLNKITALIDSREILKYNLGRSSTALYYANIYKLLEKETKQKLVETNRWAKYLEPNKLGYQIAPKELKYKLLSLELFDNYANAVITSNSAIYNYISDAYPQNIFLPYLQEEQKKLQNAIDADNSEVKFIESTINTLQDLVKIENLSLQALYIDIWATWCAPCIAELKHKDKIHNLLSKYTNVTPVYISIDDDKSDNAWKQKTKIFNLNGYNLRANQKLIEDINEQLYKSQGIGIPRYLLMDKDGHILDDNLPRPSNLEKLQQMLDKHLY